jgi:hypothetical protein
MDYRFKWLLALLLTALLASFAVGQSVVTGDIAGTVTDPSGAVVSGAEVTLKSVTEGTTVTTTTNSTGGFRFALLKPSEYKLTIGQKGFKSVSQTVTVALGQVTTANVKLELGSQSEILEVTGAAPLIQTENANISTSMSAKQVDLVPNSGNDLTAIAYTAPGVQLSSASGGGYGNFVAFGLPATANLFTVNGNDEMDPYLNLNNSGATNLLLGKNEIQEAAVVSNGYTGQYGRQAGAQIDYATQSGSNSFHGNAMYWWNGRVMNANDWFNNQAGVDRPFVNNNQYAARFGGPIVKDKAFFFVDYEGLRLINATSTDVILPSASFLQAVANNVGTGASGYTVIDPNDGVTPIQPFANNTAAVPFYQNFQSLNANAPGIGTAAPISAAVDPALGCGNLTPQTTGPLAGYGTTLPCAVDLRSVVGQPSKEWILTARTDFNLTNNDKLFLRYRMDRGLQPTTTDAVSPLFNAVSNQPQYSGQLNYTRTINPTTINSFIASGSWYSAFFDIVDRAKALQAFPYALIENSGAGWYAGGGSGLFGPSSAFPQGRNVTQYQFTDDLSMSRGIHEFKTGVNFRRNDITDGLFGRRAAEPQVYIDGGNTGFSGMDLFVNGLTGRVRQYFPKQLKQPMAIYSFGAYFQDVMRVKPNLKLTLTLRADRNSNLVCQTDCIGRLTGPFSQLNHDVNVPFNQMFTTYHSLFPDIEKVSIQPRFGFAWNPWGKSNTVVRGGVGLFSDLYPATLADSFALNSPTSNRFTFRPGLPMPISPADTANPLGAPVGQQIAACNAAFVTAFDTGQTLADYNAAAPGCAKPDYNSILPTTVANPKYLEWNVEIQQSIGQKTAVSLNYVGNRGSDLLIFNPWVNASQGIVPLITGTAWNGLPTSRPDLRVGNVSELTNNGRSNYHGVTASVTRRLTKGFQGSINYTWSHALDDVSNGGVSPFSLNDSLLGQLNPVGLAAQNYSNADYDVRHNLSAQYVWDLPFKSSNGFLNQIIGGWTISGTFFARSGYPFTVGNGYPGLFFSNTLNVTQIPAQFTGVGPTSCGKPGVDASGNLIPCLDGATQFTLDNNLVNVANSIDGNCPDGSAPGSPTCLMPTGFATTRRNIFRGPKYFNSDFDVLKRFKITERANFAVGANFYNIFNHPNFTPPNGDIADVFTAPFGTVTTTAVPATSIYGAFVGSSVSGRVVQLHARFEF